MDERAKHHKKSTKHKISKKRQKDNQAAGLKELWVDGCFFDLEGRAGGGAVLCSHEGKIEATMSFELNHLGITQSEQAELWTAVYALKALRPETVGRIISDNPIVVSSMEKIRGGKALKAGMDERLKTHLAEAVLAQPHMVIERITDGKNRPRGQGKTPLADGFAKAAARADETALDKAIRRAGNFPHKHTASPTAG